MNILVITFKTFNTKTLTHGYYEERVQLDNLFVAEDLIKIATNEKDFVKFEIFNDVGRPLYTSAVREAGDLNNLLLVEKVIRDEEILGTTYDAYSDKPHKHKTKVTWKLASGGYFTRKKDAVAYATKQNNNTIKVLKSLVK